MLVWERRLQTGNLFVDVGANVGTYSVLASSLGADVIAIEAAADTAALLRENVALNGGTVEVLECAVGSSLGSVSFTVGRDSVNHVVHGSGTTNVVMRTLDEILGGREVSGMKIDVEGYELEVLRGAKSALGDQRIRLIQLEWNDCADRTPIAELLSDYGYFLFEPLPDGTLAPRSARVSADDLFAAPG
jgi:FkbM family methyltransferase